MVGEEGAAHAVGLLGGFRGRAGGKDGLSLRDRRAVEHERWKMAPAFEPSECARGAFTRFKGGSHLPPFMFDSSSVAKGQAILTSSSASEASQESDSVGGSFFTHHLMSGL